MNAPAYTTLTRLPSYDWTPPETAEILPGFVEAGVTFESHTFWVDFERRDKARPEAVIYVSHGAGHESLRVRHMIAAPLRALIDAGQTREAFKLCWGVHENARGSYIAGADYAKAELVEAFIKGQLKKRKKPGREVFKVWIEKPGQFENVLYKHAHAAPE